MRSYVFLLGITLTACGTGRTTILDDRDAGAARDGGTVTRDGGTVFDGGSIVDSGIRIPMKRRPTATQCDMTRPTPPVDPNSGNPNDECKAHSECTAGMNGRCLAQRFGYVCTYDECFEDNDCSTVCQCGGGFGGDHNICLRQGNCSVDADCGAGNFCSPTFSECGDYSGTVGYFCHTQQDECIDDSDCGTYPWYCRYEQTVGRWTCSDSHCAG